MNGFYLKVLKIPISMIKIILKNKLTTFTVDKVEGLNLVLGFSG